MTITEMTIPEFHAAIKAQGVSSHKHAAFVCPACGYVQSMADHIAAGATPEQAEQAIGWACVGHRTGAGSPRKIADGKPCNWTLGGLFQIHTLEVIDEKGGRHPRFALATPSQAKAHEAGRKQGATA
jgi:hypothetical protein